VSRHRLTVEADCHQKGGKVVGAVKHPINTPDFTSLVEVRLLWHERVEGEPSHEWLHEILRRAAEYLRYEQKQ